MNIANLSFSALPPISVPFRYFISAVIFLLITALLILTSGETIWLNRWQPTLLAVTHLFTLGSVSMVMMGAIYQFLPVIGGVGIANVRIVATLSHSLHTLGTLVLAWSFIFPSTLAHIIAMLALGLGFSGYIFSVIQVLVKKLSQGQTIIGIRLAMLSLISVVLLGLLFIAQRSLILDVNISFLTDKNYTDIHALLGGFGWAGLLILAVSLQIIPMFHVTPNFPKWLGKYLPSVLVLLLLLLFIFKPNSTGGQLIIALVLVLYSIFNLAFLRLFKQRKRKVVDTSVSFWQFSGISFLALSCLYFLPDVFYQQIFAGNKALALSAVFSYFYLLSIIEAMLLKIMPFLTYTHLQNLCLVDFNAMSYLPHMHELLLKKHGQMLFKLHVISCFFLILTIAIASFYALFAIAMLVEFSWLLFLMLRSLYLYRQCLAKIKNNTL
ncbi:hypothetical protein FGD67_00855 [Colwellia sp. M166]|mgnify:FL=1|uniref:hypothetical protein n=1 Tax=Colwellia sp. M166 TaxID=2583805 RepID=UPI00211E50F6|nr:hypothetical protein [Colwellia sp. M166]UUO21907.1 hypothetical protein FGD67_00855 [Colwellia sp. M166]|tara:strand:+ start:16633 stop:17946 length:1314 start_codon:yes stop_codon:yes gene_type:complete